MVKTNRVVIIADGLEHSFLPLSLEKPKALWKVRGEILIERLLKQANEAGIFDITIVIGYKKEMFSYLEKEFNVSFFENKDFRKKDVIKNFSSIESCLVFNAGDYYLDNPFLNDKAEMAKLDTFVDLRYFDVEYERFSESSILGNIKFVLHCEENDICNFRYLNCPQTNISFIFEVKGKEYVYRHPALGNSELVNWENEKKSMIIAKELGIDPSYLYSDSHEGWKIMEYLGPHVRPDYYSFEDSKKVIKLLRKLHSTNIVADYGLKIWEDTENMLKNLYKMDPDAFTPYQELREEMHKLYKKTINDGVEKCFCHGDCYCQNIMMLPNGSVALIDWEYAGYSDPGIDIGFYIVDAEYDLANAEKFIREYLQDEFSESKLLHFLIYAGLMAYYNFIWALNRRAIGEPRDDIQDKCYIIAKKYINYLTKNSL